MIFSPHKSPKSPLVVIAPPPSPIFPILFDIWLMVLEYPNQVTSFECHSVLSGTIHAVYQALNLPTLRFLSRILKFSVVFYY